MFKSERKVFNFNKKTLIISILLTFLCLPLNANALSNTKVLYIGSNGSYSFRTFNGGSGTIISSPSQLNFSGGSHFVLPVSGTIPIQSPTSFRFDWTLDTSILSTIDTLEFIVSSRSNYSNIAYLALPGQGYITCNIKSLTTDLGSLNGAIYSTAYVCSFDSAYLTDNTTTLYFIAQSSPYVSENMSSYSNVFYINNMVVGYKSNNLKEDISDAIQGDDLTNDDSIDDAPLQDYQDKENAIINSDALDKINDIEIAIDSNTNLFIWNLVDSILNTHSLVFGMFIAILSVGLIKLILNR